MLAATLVDTLPAWLTAVVVVFGAFMIWRGGGGTALGVLQDANRVLEARVHELEKAQKKDAETIAHLRGRTDITVALAPLLEWTVLHERHAQERHEASLRILGLIAERLGPEQA